MAKKSFARLFALTCNAEKKSSGDDGDYFQLQEYRPTNSHGCCCFQIQVKSTTQHPIKLRQLFASPPLATAASSLVHPPGSYKIRPPSSFDFTVSLNSQRSSLPSVRLESFLRSVLPETGFLSPFSLSLQLRTNRASQFQPPPFLSPATQLQTTPVLSPPSVHHSTVLFSATSSGANKPNFSPVPPPPSPPSPSSERVPQGVV